MRNSTRNANALFLEQNTHKRVKLPSNFKGKVSHLLMPNTDLKHWQTQTTKTSRNELWFSVLVKNLKTQQEMRQRVCFVSPTGAYIKGKSLLSIAKSITQKKDPILPLPSPSHTPTRPGELHHWDRHRSGSCFHWHLAEDCFWFLEKMFQTHFYFLPVARCQHPSPSLPLGALGLKVFGEVLTFCCIYGYF